MSINKQITFTCIYVNNDNKITNVIKEVLVLQNENIVSRPELVDIIKKNSFFLDKRYSVLSILKYNIIGKEKNSDEEEEEASDSDVEEAQASDEEEEDSDEEEDQDDVNTITSCISDYDIDFNSSYLTVIKNIEDIQLENTLPSFQDLNEILILFYDKNNIADINTNKTPSFSQTKRVYINNKNKINTKNKTTRRIRFSLPK
jgi:hypothetical protein